MAFGAAWLVVMALGCSSASESEPPVEAATLVPDDPDSLGLDAETRQAFQILLTTERFTDAAIGYAGITPLEVRAWRRLIDQPRAAQLFATLLDHARLGGRLYALCGLFYTDPARFEREVDALAGSKATVEFMSGCEIDPEQPVAELVRAGGDHVVRLDSRDQTTKAWIAAHGVTTPYTLDIAGGGYPDLFRNGGGWSVPTVEPLDPAAGR